MQAVQSLAENRSRIYWFLSEFYNVKPNMEFILELRSNLKSIDEADKAEILGGLLLKLESFLENLNESEIEMLQVSFTRLFRGISKDYSPPPPYESVYRGEGRVYGLSTERVMEFYAECGFGVIDDTVGPQDHITAELKFMAMLCFKESQTGEDYWIKKQLNFLSNHALKWIPEFCRRIEREGDGFYSLIAKITRKWLEADFEYLREVSEDEKNSC
jgi:TorA maturation chaperone TorD